MKSLILLFFLFVVGINASAQTPINKALLDNTSQIPLFKLHNLLLQHARYIEAPKMPNTRTTGSKIFDTAQWNQRVDSTWGAFIPDSVKLNGLDTFWVHVDSAYPGFVHLPLYNWDSIINGMQAQIKAGVSDGKFTEIINYLLRLMNDGHSSFYDYINYPSAVYQGLPLFRGESGELGACVTTLDDTLAMVYDAHPDQPFGLQPGDIILGYNDIPWKKLVQIILSYNLPNSVYKGSTDSATFHRYIQAVGENWYLFDTINIKKCNGSYVNLPTSLMAGTHYLDFCTEQMQVPGIKKISNNGYYNDDSTISFGILQGTHIGYIYMYDCEDISGLKLYNATKALVEDSMAAGLILDIRTNYGGTLLAYERTFEYLTNGNVSWLGVGERNDPKNRLAMQVLGPPSWYDIYDTDVNYFNHPIAILCGPNAVSAGDVLPVMYKHNPRVKLFGKSTAGAFGALSYMDVDKYYFITSKQDGNFFQASDTSFYLSHTMFPVDFPVWFNKDSVCAGKDNVVSKAVQWINSTEGVKSTMLQTPNITIFPNPAYQYINIAISSPVNDHLSIKLCNMLGIVIKEISSDISTGDNAIKMDIASSEGVATGNYLLYIQGNNGDRIIKKVSVVR